MVKRLFLSFCLVFILPVLAFGAVGDTVSTCSNVSTLAVLDIQPSAGIEWVIQNIYFVSTIDLQRYDGSNITTFQSLTGPDIFQVIMRMTNTNRVRVKNTSVSSQLICYDGLVVK